MNSGQLNLDRFKFW
nr:DUF645 family protein [Vibrio cholerae]